MMDCCDSHSHLVSVDNTKIVTFSEMIAPCCDNHKKPIDALFGQCPEFLDVKEGGIYIVATVF
jgi:hypothetical protein